MTFQQVLRTNTWLIVFLAIIISFIFPKIGMVISPGIGYLLMILMYLTCLDINGKQVVQQFINWKKIIIILLIIHFLSPIIIYFLKPLFSTEIFVGLILAAAMPSGMSVVFLSCLYCESTKSKSSNRIKQFFQNVINRLLPIRTGSSSKALVITTISHLISPLLIPVIILVFANTIVNIDTWPISLMIIKFIIIPLAFAKFFTSLRLKKKFKKYSSSTSLVLLFLIMLGVISPLKDTIIQNWKLSLFIASVVFCLLLINFLVGYMIGKGRNEKITYGITANYKNFTLASVIALSLFTPLVALPTVIYVVMSNVFLIFLQLILLRKK